MLPLYMVGNKQSRDIGKGQYDRAIEKSEKAISRVVKTKLIFFMEFWLLS